ncbi:MAG: class I SAM-dependent methyltransferase [Silvanigrellales bacterium]|nr:class I SAM-dependent methyltransferase [Silvanigrellales bacterium]
MTSAPMKQELFEIDAKGKNHRIRPERFTTAGRNSSLVIDGRATQILNYSAFAVAIICDKNDNRIFKGREKAVFKVEDMEVQEIEISSLYVQDLEGERRKIVFEVINEPVNVEKIQGFVRGFFVCDEITRIKKSEPDIPAKFKAAVGSLQDFLIGVKTELDAMEHEIRAKSIESNSSEIDGICLVITNFLTKEMPRFYEMLSKELPQEVRENSESVSECIDYLRSKLGDLIYSAPIANRSYFKPAGYAGDFEMMNQIYRDNFEGSSIYAKCMHKYFIDQSAAKAVKNRANFLLKKIEETCQNASGEIHIASLACGPAYEVQLFCKKLNPYRKINFHFFDQDLNALQHAQRYILESCMKSGVSNVTCHFHNLALRNILGRGFPEGQKFDFVYSAGLFDYLSTSVAKACVKKMIKATKSGGKIIIGNFDVSNPTRGVMELALDWNLIHRSATELSEIACDSLRDVSVEKEDEGVNLFVVGRVQ